MKSYLLLGAAALALTACVDGVLDPSTCAMARDNMKLADEAIAQYQVQYPDNPLPAVLTNNYATAKALVAVVCPAPVEAAE